MTAWLSLAISLVAVALMVIVTRRMIDRRTRSGAVMDDIRREVGAILTEMNQTTERNIELVEDRLKGLQQLIEQADRRMGTLRREAQKRESSEMVYSHLSRVVQPSPPLSVEDAEVPPTVEVESGDGTESAGDLRTEVPLRERVLGLYRQGIPIERIASRVGTAVSEVELIVSIGER